MSKTCRCAALTMAANFRHDVKKFIIDEKTHRVEVVMYSGDVIKGEMNWDQYEEDVTMCQILEEILGPEPRLKNPGTRSVAAMAQRKKWHGCRLCETG